jgi:soluble lytic murein transglycosylase
MGASKVEHQIYIVALGRLAKTSVKLATLALNKAAPKMTAQEQQQAWAAIALQSSYTLAPETTDYWKRANGAPLSIDQAQWKARIALRNGDWKTVESTIRAMPPSLRSEPTWIYWLGRALMARDGVTSQPAAKRCSCSAASPISRTTTASWRWKKPAS